MSTPAYTPAPLGRLSTNAVRALKRIYSRPPKARVVRLVRANQLITLRDLARKLGMSQAAALDECEAEGLNVNIGVRVGGSCGNLIGEHSRIGDYTVEDLTV